MSHTPGPWTASDYGQYLGGKRGKLSIVATSPPKIVAENVNPEDGPLIEAAPDLLAQLKAIMVQIESMGLVVPPGPLAAIAKAQGTPAS